MEHDDNSSNAQKSYDTRIGTMISYEKAPMNSDNHLDDTKSLAQDYFFQRLFEECSDDNQKNMFKNENEFKIMLDGCHDIMKALLKSYCKSKLFFTYQEWSKVYNELPIIFEQEQYVPEKFENKPYPLWLTETFYNYFSYEDFMYEANDQCTTGYQLYPRSTLLKTIDGVRDSKNDDHLHAFPTQKKLKGRIAPIQEAWQLASKLKNWFNPTNYIKSMKDKCIGKHIMKFFTRQYLLQADGK